jgi:hypothetical protein
LLVAESDRFNSLRLRRFAENAGQIDDILPTLKASNSKRKAFVRRFQRRKLTPNYSLGFAEAAQPKATKFVAFSDPRE